MCGIAGFWRPGGDHADQAMKSLQRMTDALQHRGPDADGHWFDPQHGIALGHRRLAIVDLSPTGAQPMRSPTGRFVVVFNGEIYNYRRLRDELTNKGVTFRGTSDTEVMLAAFEQWGFAETLPKLAGMFALAVWDSAREQLFLARDRMGEKPLYLSRFDGQLAFASEIKALRTLPAFPTEIDPSAFADVLRTGYIGRSHSVFRAVTRLCPGEYATVSNANGIPSVRTARYWSVPDEVQFATANAMRKSDDDATTALDSLLTQVVGDEMVADVPVGAFLSGGIDSSLIVALMQKVASQRVRTFTIGFRESTHDESPFAREVAGHLGTEHTEIMLSSNDALAFVERLPAIFDEPFADSSQLPTLLVSAVTRQHVTVALSGDAGDELFGGYSQYLAKDGVTKMIGRVPSVLRSPLSSVVNAIPRRLANAMLSSGTTWAPNTRARLIRELRNPSRVAAYQNSLARWVAPSDVMKSGDYSRSDSPWPKAATDEESRMAFDMQHYLPDDILVKVDRSAMASSLETRAPLLDHRVVQFALQTPLSQKIRHGRGKFLLRNLLARYIPQPMIDRPKQGFAIPLGEWLRGPLKSWGDAVLEPDKLLSTWFQPSVVSALWKAHQQGVDHSNQLWPLLMIMQWLRSSSNAA